MALNCILVAAPAGETFTFILLVGFAESFSWQPENEKQKESSRIIGCKIFISANKE